MILDELRDNAITLAYSDTIAVMLTKEDNIYSIYVITLGHPGATVFYITDKLVINGVGHLLPNQGITMPNALYHNHKSNIKAIWGVHKTGGYNYIVRSITP